VAVSHWSGFKTPTNLIFLYPNLPQDSYSILFIGMILLVAIVIGKSWVREIMVPSIAFFAVLIGVGIFVPIFISLPVSLGITGLIILAMHRQSGGSATAIE
jgi:hypothetical protein